MLSTVLEALFYRPDRLFAQWKSNMASLPSARRPTKGVPPTRWLAEPWTTNAWYLWVFPHRWSIAVDIAPAVVYEADPAIDPNRPVQKHPVLREHLVLLWFAFVPVAGQAVSYLVLPEYKWPWWFAFGYYFGAIDILSALMLFRFHHYMVLYGVLDQHRRGRDLVGDGVATQFGMAAWTFFALRIASVMLATGWDQEVVPTIGWMAYPKIVVHLIVLDLFYYIYHRSCHQIPHFWPHHARHHMVKHPSGTHAILSDWLEVLDVGTLPLVVNSVGPKLSFGELWVTLVFTVYWEMFVHTGIRADWAHPLLGPILEPFGVDIQDEDHDLHHRWGRSSANFGKQTRIWDTLFGTTGQRIELPSKTKKQVEHVVSDEETGPSDRHRLGFSEDEDEGSVAGS